MTLSEPLQITRHVADILEQLEVPYLVGGSLASSLHGIPRATQDADLIVDMQTDHVARFVKAVEPAFYVDADMIRGAIKRSASFNIIYLATMFKVDMFISKRDPFSLAVMARRERYQLAGDPVRELFVATAEDTVLRKLEWFRLGGEVSERQWRDVAGILLVQKDRLDRVYMETQSRLIGVAGLLARAFKELEAL